MFVFSKFCENLRHKTQNILFAQLNISILQENATVDLSIVLLEIIRVPMYMGVTFKFMSSRTLFYENENLMQFRGLTISKFTYHN